MSAFNTKNLVTASTVALFAAAAGFGVYKAAFEKHELEGIYKVDKGYDLFGDMGNGRVMFSKQKANLSAKSAAEEVLFPDALIARKDVMTGLGVGDCFKATVAGIPSKNIVGYFDEYNLIKATKVTCPTTPKQG